MKDIHKNKDKVRGRDNSFINKGMRAHGNLQKNEVRRINNILNKGRGYREKRSFSSKGFVEGVTWTAIVLIITVISVIALIAVMTFFLLPFTPGKPFSFDITFVDLINRPYLVASSVGNAKFLDRTFFEHALEAAVVKGLENSNSEAVPLLVEDYLEFYDLTYFSISVKKEDKKIFEINNLPKKCGVEAYCTPRFFVSEAGLCNVGRIETDGACDDKQLPVCCKEDKAAYEASPESLGIIPCGKDDIGVCSAELDLSCILDEVKKKVPCGFGRSKIKDVGDRCKDLEKIPMCCAPIDVAAVSVGDAFSAQIPLLYKGEQAILEVAIK